MEIIRFGRHKGTSFGHIIVRKRSGFPPRWRNWRLKVRLIDDKWIDENGRDVTQEVNNILIKSYIEVKS